MKGYKLLSDIREEFKVSYQTLDKHLEKLNITKRNENRRVYIKDSEYDILYKSLSNSSRIKKIAEIDFAEYEAESHKEELLQKHIIFLEKRVKDLESDISFKNKEIESFHGVIAANSLKVDGLERQIKLIEASKEEEIKKIEKELQDKTKVTYKLEDEIQIKEREVNKLNEELINERNSKELIINQYTNMKFKDKIKFLLKSK